MVKYALAAVVSAGIFAGLSVAPRGQGATPGSGNDLDQFMKQVLAKRDDNWKKLEQYVFDERETVDVLGPGRVQLWGDRREYTWFIREGFFVRSPVKANGVTIGEEDRRKSEKEYIERQRRRERRRANRQDGDEAKPVEADQGDFRGKDALDEPELDVNGLLRQTRDPEFISQAYFVRFKFDEGHYALAGRETIDGNQVLKIEYYPTNLFRLNERERERQRQRQRETEAQKPQEKEKKERCIGLCGEQYDESYEEVFRRLMNKTSMVTIWVEPTAQQIVQYKFQNVDMDFVPARWLARLDGFNADMRMTQAFPGMWMPTTMNFQIVLSAAVGQFDIQYHVDYRDYRQPDVKSKITVPKGQ